VVTRVYHDDPEHILFQVRIELHPFTQEIVHRAGGFDAGETGAGYHHRQRRLALGFVQLVVRQLQRINDAVSHQNGVAKRLHRERVLFEAGRVVEVCHCAKRQDELVVSEIERAVKTAMPNSHLLLDEIDRLDVGNAHTSVSKHLPQRLDDIGNRHVASGDLVEHRCEEHEILPGNDHDFNVRHAAKPLLEVQRGIGAGKATAQN
jgi:hypothetical protein